MNTYKITFNYGSKPYFCTMTANQIANFVMSQAHELQSFADMIFTRDNEDFQYTFKKNDKFYKDLLKRYYRTYENQVFQEKYLREIQRQAKIKKEKREIISDRAVQEKA